MRSLRAMVGCCSIRWFGFSCRLDCRAFSLKTLFGAKGSYVAIL